MYYTYVLISEDGRRTYTGITSDLEKRFDTHNSGHVRSSQVFRPFKILLKEEFKTKVEARKREIFYKSRTGRRRLKEILSKTGPSKC